MSRWSHPLSVVYPCFVFVLSTAITVLAVADDFSVDPPAITPPVTKADDSSAVEVNNSSSKQADASQAAVEKSSEESPKSSLQQYDKEANPGIDMLDRALSMRLTAEKLADLGTIVSCCEKAIELGLDQFNENMAKTVIATTLTERARVTAKAAFRPGQGRKNWMALRTIALRDLKKALESKPDYPEALFLMTELQLLPGGDRKAAIKTLDELLLIENLEPEQRDKALLLRANLEDDLSAKQAFLDKALNEDPDDIDALRMRGLTYMTLGKLEAAKADFQRAFELDPKSADTCEALATVLLDLDQLEEAEKIIDKLSLLSPNSASSLIIRAQLNAKKKDLPAALDNLNHALELEPTNTRVLLLRAYLYHEMDLDEQAMGDVKKILQIRPKFEQARRLYIALLAQKGDLNKTLEELTRFHKEQPDDAELTLQLATLYAMKKDIPKAIELYTELIEKDPQNSAALEGRAGVLLGNGKQAEAIADYDKALAISPNESDILNNLAWVLATSPDAKLRDGKRAIKLATKACELTDYRAAHILSTLAAAYAETGNFEEAIKYSTKAVELGKESKDPEMQEALQKELASYKAKKPWRELLKEGLPTPDEDIEKE